MKINGKPYHPYTIKNQLEKYKKKKKKERLKVKSNEIIPDIQFSANGKPTNVYNLNESQPQPEPGTELHLMPFDLKSKNLTISRLTQPSKNNQMSGEELSRTKTATTKPRVKLKPSNSPIYTYKLPPNLNLDSFQSLRSILGNIKTSQVHHEDLLREKTTNPLVLMISSTEKSSTTSTTTTSISTTNTA